jgi:hypothetical protein
MKKAVMCIVQNQGHAESIVVELRHASVSDNDISVLFPNKAGTRDFAHERHTKAPEGTVAGVGAGGMLGGAMGLLAGIGVLVIPGVGPLIAAGPLLAALSGAAAGATVGGITGALIGAGIPEMEAKRYEGKIRGGNFLISVHTDSRQNQRRVEAILRKARAGDICSTCEASIPKAQQFHDKT